MDDDRLNRSARGGRVGLGRCLAGRDSWRRRRAFSLYKHVVLGRELDFIRFTGS